MGIRIDEINAQGLGPLNEFNETMGDLNLIYGKNEQGKTYLVEFLIKSLFKNYKEFNLRSNEPNGKVIISGLDNDPVFFSPKGPRKLEDYLLKDHPGMPVNISKLLVVKGADLSFDHQKTDGVSKAIIKSFLTSESTLDQIRNKIQKTVRNAKNENGIIQGARAGKIKTTSELEEKLKDLDRLHNEVNDVLSEGYLTELQYNKNKTEVQINEQLRAKKYLAYTKQQQIQEIKRKIENVDVNDLDQLRENFNACSRLQGELEEIQAKFNQASEDSRHFPWLETAVDEYQNLMSRGGTSPKKLMLIIGGVLIGFGLLLGIGGGLISITAEPVVGFSILSFGMAMLIIGLVFGWFYLRQFQQRNETYAESEEIKRIEKSFQKKFKKPLKDIATLKEHEKTLSKIHTKATTYQESIAEVKIKIRDLAFATKSGLQKFKLPVDDPDSWNEKIQSLEKKLNKWKHLLQDAEVAFASLGIEEDDLITDNPEIVFESNRLNQLEKELTQSEEALKSIEMDFELLKTKVQTTIKNNSSTTWDTLLDYLRQERCQVAAEYRSATSEIYAGILVNDIIEDVRAKDDEKIIQQLKSPMIREPLSKITTHYEYINFKEETIIVGDQYNEFEIGDLSTGAKEQVLLAIRLGLTTNIIGGNTAFFILDDAFQHSDWDRRELLLEQVIDLTRSGWQIIYFTMDDHIRKLFQKYGKGNFDGVYKEFDLR